MATRRNDARLAEAGALRDWCQAILSFLRELGLASDIADEFGQVVENALAERNVRGLRMVAKDLQEWVRGLPMNQQAQLEERLNLQFGRGIRSETDKDQREVAHILERGVIADEDEYRLLVARAEAVHADKARATELERINELLARTAREGRRFS
jgi:hypothetical protein